MENNKSESNRLQNFKIEEPEDLLVLLPQTVYNHCKRVALCSSVIAEHTENGFNIFDIPPKTSLPVLMHFGGICHDIGKVLANNTDNYLRHPEAGMNVLTMNKEAFFDNEKHAKIVLEIVLNHHEYLDGSGFPKGLQGFDIPPPAWICTIANDLDNRMYEEKVFPKSNKHILKEMKKQVGIKYFEYAVKCLEKSWPQLMEMYKKWMK